MFWSRNDWISITSTLIDWRSLFLWLWPGSWNKMSELVLSNRPRINLTSIKMLPARLLDLIEDWEIGKWWAVINRDNCCPGFFFFRRTCGWYWHVLSYFTVIKMKQLTYCGWVSELINTTTKIPNQTTQVIVAKNILVKAIITIVIVKNTAIIDKLW